MKNEKIHGCICAWCENEFMVATRQLGQTCCSVKCSREYVDHGNAPSKRQVEERKAHIARQPKGAKTVAEFLAMGGVIWREEYGARA